jgi:predicted acyl esterase
MAEDTDLGVDCALKVIVNAVNLIKHVKSELKKTILESVSTLRNKIHALQKDRADKSARNIESQTEVDDAKREIQAYKDARSTISVAPSIERKKKPEATVSDAQRQPSDRNTKLYSKIVADRENNRKFRITIRSKESHTPEHMKKLPKTKINPIEVKAGISAFKTLKDGRILIEVGSKEERKRISNRITEKCGKELEAKIQE